MTVLFIKFHKWWLETVREEMKSISRMDCITQRKDWLNHKSSPAGEFTVIVVDRLSSFSTKHNHVTISVGSPDHDWWWCLFQQTITGPIWKTKQRLLMGLARFKNAVTFNLSDGGAAICVWQLNIFHSTSLGGETIIQMTFIGLMLM